MRYTLIVAIALVVGSWLWFGRSTAAVPAARPAPELAQTSAQQFSSQLDPADLAAPQREPQCCAEHEAPTTASAAALAVAKVTLAPLGDLPSDLRTRVATDLQENVRRKELALARLRAEGGGLMDEANLSELIELRSAQLRMLESGDYLLVKPGEVGKAWPASPPGWRIVTYETVVLDDGLLADLVFPVRVADHAGMVDSIRFRRGIEQFTAEDAAYRFNGLDSEERHAALRAVEARPKRTGADTEAEIWVRLARARGYRVDQARLLLRRR